MHKVHFKLSSCIFFKEKKNVEILVPENSTKNNRGLKKLFISTQNIPLVPVLHSDFLEQSVILWHLYFKILSAALFVT